VSVPFKIPGPGWLSGSQWVTCEEGQPQRLIGETTIRGIDFPDGTTIHIEPEFKDICLVPPVPIVIRGWSLPAHLEVVIFNLVSVPFNGCAALGINAFRNLVLSPLGVLDVGRTAWVHLKEGGLNLHGFELPPETRLFFRPDGALEVRPGAECRLGELSAPAQSQVLISSPSGRARLVGPAATPA
jgi:hypothetical protein